MASYPLSLCHQVRPKHKGEARALREHQQKAALASLTKAKPLPAMTRVKEMVGGVMVEGKVVGGGKVEVKVKREDESEEEEEWEFDEEEEEEAGVVRGVRV